MSITSISSNEVVKPHNFETSRVSELIPQGIAQNAEGFIKLIKSYYDYINTEGLPSYEINHIVDNHDIDKISNVYLDNLQEEIAKNIPNSKVLDRVSLYKKIVKFYTIRGSEESLITFFRIFFDEIVSVEYPKDRLFKLSDGDFRGYDNPTSIVDKQPRWDDRKSFISDINRLHDGDFWQEFSYVINTSLSSDQWENEYVRMVHPAGLKFFVAILFILKLENEWIGPNVKFNSASQTYVSDYDVNRYKSPYRTRNPLVDLDWMKGLTPPSFTDPTSSAFHTPLFQPGWLTGDERFLDIIIEALQFPLGENDSSFQRAVLTKLHLFIESIKNRDDFAKQDFLQNLKFTSNTEISYYLNHTIEEVTDEANNTVFNNIGALVDISFIQNQRLNTEDDRNIKSENDVDYITT